MSLSAEDRKTLLALARQAITRQAHGEEIPDIDIDAASEGLQKDRASFVTLNKNGQLRGCIGALEARQPLILDVRDNAIGAAFRDPRFPPVKANEVDDLQIEISVLTQPQPLAYEDAADLVSKLRPDVDGVIIQRGWNRATFLPQVWEKLSDPHQFLQRLCQKAFLPPNAYRNGDLAVYTYQVEKFEEERE